MAKNLDESIIPEGIYCYNKNYICPYWGLRKDKPYQENGYCEYLKRGDWMGGFSLLWDQVKECDVKISWCME